MGFNKTHGSIIYSLKYFYMRNFHSFSKKNYHPVGYHNGFF